MSKISVNINSVDIYFSGEYVPQTERIMGWIGILPRWHWTNNHVNDLSNIRRFIETNRSKAMIWQMNVQRLHI